eukprot:TRINITY_DN898_c0_g1_i1.p1 TRINITY_DN898_c0_g1~~TRINITY_DN898_c0_g1_i1.p1  ORF type:complete len:184 (+),score=17.30 TRINITY_DN898_c0_g1_i1:462-1013(+)
MKTFFTDWYSHCMDYVRIGLIRMENVLPYVVYQSFLGNELVIVNENNIDTTKLERLIELLKFETECDHEDHSILTISPEQIHINTTETSPFIEDWSSELLKLCREEQYIDIRSVIQQKKDEFSCEIETNSSLILAAHSDHYSNFTLYQSLKKSAFRGICIKILKAQSNEEDKNILDVIWNLLI